MNILHFLETKRKNHELNSLNTSLADFGLSPSEWCVIKEDCMNYKITNKLEPSFFFKGRVHFKKGKKQWLSIYLASL